MLRVGFVGNPILIEFLPDLRAARGKLHSGGARGSPVHAGSFLRQRRIVLDADLLRDKRELERILAHEIFHFVWWKLGGNIRAHYESLLQDEADRAVSGEMGWSSEWRKAALRKIDLEARTRRWREYICESFCDTAAADLIAMGKHPEVTLPAPDRRRRQLWMEANLKARSLKI